MVSVDLNTDTLSVLIAGIYCTGHQVNSAAIPQSVWLSVAEKLEFFLPNWDYSKISFEQWVGTHLLIMPKPMLDENEIKELESSTLYWEVPNGNIMLIISMDIKPINGE